MAFERLYFELGEYSQHLMHGTKSSNATRILDEAHDDELIESVTKIGVYSRVYSTKKSSFEFEILKHQMVLNAIFAAFLSTCVSASVFICLILRKIILWR
jgi:hypothetical protein